MTKPPDIDLSTLHQIDRFVARLEGSYQIRSHGDFMIRIAEHNRVYFLTRSGRARSVAQRMRRYRERQRAAGLRAITRMEAPVHTLSGGALKHRIIEARSLAMHCLAAQKIMLDPALLDRVRRTLDAWRARYGRDAPRALDEWAAILRRPWPQIAAFLTPPPERLPRAAGRIAGERELVIIGSQSVLGQFPDAPVALLMSMEADLYPRAHPELADKAEGA